MATKPHFDRKIGKEVTFPDGTVRYVGKLQKGFWKIDGVIMKDEEVKSMLIASLDWATPCIENFGDPNGMCS